MNELNDAAILDQMREHWQKLAALILWKLSPDKPLILSAKDLESAPPLVLLTHGHKDSIEFRLVTPEEAARIVHHDAATNRGRA